MSTPDYQIRGATLAGTPFFSIGHNQHIAWGMTGGSSDNTDLYLEELNSARTMFREGDSFQPLQITHRTIRIKGQESFQDQILITPRGPIISDVLDDLDLDLSFKAAWAQPQPMKKMFSIYQAKNFEEFRNTWSRWYQATLNMVYADEGDTIGWQFIGHIPDRKRNHTIPVPSWDPDFLWKSDQIAFQDMPYIKNPELGLVATANNQPAAADELYLGYDYPGGYRLARIVELLRSRQDWDLEGMAELQLDLLAIPWREMRDIVINIPPTSPTIQEALGYLESWNGEVTPDSPAASLYEFFLSEINLLIIDVKAPQAKEWAQGKEMHPLIYAPLGKRQVSLISRLVREQPEGWLEGSWDDLIGRALESALNKLKTEYGSSPEKWVWGMIRPLTLTHPFGNHPLLGKVFNLGPYPWGGDTQTVAQAQRSLKIPTMNPTGIANMRMILDVGQWENNLFVLAGGQSGNPFSHHYDDQIPLWQRGEGLTLAWEESSIKDKAVATLQLEPKKEPIRSCSDSGKNA
jgi:penicillin amidase